VSSIDIVIAVDQDVPEARHVAERAGKPLVEPAVLLQQVEQFPVRARFAKAPVRHDVRRHVERGLDGDLQGVFDEPLLADVDRQSLGSRQPAELREACLDERQLLGDEGRVRHACPSLAVR